MTQRLLLSTCLFLTFFSCRDEFSLEGDFQDVPVAFAYLDAEDERHFVRVEKAFLEAGGNAETNAGDPNNIYYAADEATVILNNLTTNTSRELERVDARDFGLNRTDGVFATDPNVAYSFTDDDLEVRAGDEVELLIERPGETTATASTTLLEPVEIVRPNDLVRIDNPNRPLIMSWTKGEAASIYDVRIFFNIRELFPADASMNRNVRLEWQLQTAYVPGEGDESGRTVRLAVDPTGFYRFLGENLEENGNIVRRFESFDVQVSAAGEEVLELRNLQNANSGITSSGALPRYSNITGGFGIITSNTTTLKEGIGFDGGSVDSLRDGRFTRDLNFN